MTDDADALLARIDNPFLSLDERKALRAQLTTAFHTPKPPPTFTRSQIRDVAFFTAHRGEILAAAARGDIVDDLGGAVVGARGSVRRNEGSPT